MHFLSIFPLAGLLIIVLLIVVKVVLLKRKGISLKTSNPKSPGANRMLYPGFVIILLIWLMAMAGRIFSLHPFLQESLLTKNLVSSPILTTTGAIVILLSLILMGITLVHFKTSLRFGLDRNNQDKLITEGIFAFSRNPFFLSLDLYFVGQALIFPGILFIFMALMAITGIHLFILKEEKFLQMHYQNRYINYARKVRRYI